MRRRWHRRGLLASLALASASLSACGDNHGDDSAELQAILQDGDLTEIMNSMLTDAPGKPGPGTAGTGGAMAGTGGSMVGTGGSTGGGGTVGAEPGMAGRGSAGTVGAGGITMMGVGGTSVTGVGGTGGTGPTRNLPGEAQGFWRFDDCN